MARTHDRRPRESKRMLEGAPRGEWRGWQVKGPLDSEPRLEYWGGNANALLRSTLYSLFSPLILPCGTIFPRKSYLAGVVDALHALDINHIA